MLIRILTNAYFLFFKDQTWYNKGGRHTCQGRVSNASLLRCTGLALILLQIFVFIHFGINDKMADASVKTGDGD